jgi:nitrogen-specific signal transduction histidine kinase/CheY-like chemotaxis protein
VNCFRDLSAQKQAEQERVRLTEDLRQAKKLDALGQLMAGVTHDFNNLLTAVLGNLELLGNQITDKGALRLLENAVRVARRGAVLNQRLLAFARKQPLMPKAVGLNEILAQMGDLLRATIGEAIRLETRTEPAVWPALVDPNQIELVVLNLAINARDAMPFGGTLTIETRNAILGAIDRPEDLAAGEYAVLSLSDTGTGMSEEVRTRAFEPFFTTKEPDKGSGLGLSIALGVARQSGGGVRIVSRPGEGTLIEIYLPRADRQMSPEHVVKSPAVAGAVVGSETVLVVDDDGDVREATVAMLASCGYHAIEAGSGPAAIEIVASRARVDLMVVDVAMPGVNGIETARQAREWRPDLPVLFSSGYADVARFGGGDVDPDRIISKPYRRDELSRKVRACLDTGG